MARLEGEGNEMSTEDLKDLVTRFPGNLGFHLSYGESLMKQGLRRDARNVLSEPEKFGFFNFDKALVSSGQKLMMELGADEHDAKVFAKITSQNGNWQHLLDAQWSVLSVLVHPYDQSAPDRSEPPTEYPESSGCGAFKKI